MAAPNETMLALVLSKDGRLPEGEALGSAIRRHLPQAQTPDKEVPGGTSVFLVDGGMVAIGGVAAPAPIAQDDPCVAYAWHWKDVWSVIEGHAGHVVVAVTGGADAKARARLLGRAITAVIETTPSACAVHFAGSDALWPAALVAEAVSKGGDEPPVPFCVAVALGRDPDGGVSAITKGLDAFGLMEIETRGYLEDPSQLSGFLLDLAAYLIDAGDVLSDGDTIGPDADTKIIVRREASVVAPGQNVYRLYFPTQGHA
ncbi:hypothetical protein A1351_08880 [Methylosinus sp. R-45379]|uniref:DUF4261 domain-containing protein n=1 Tax=Methylosinus sp. R-45379 TaxID=980563 RepID=UPI0007C8C8A4|nr:DUF4261 domain-containing protein [Methylosinus sp. R-45379]OAI30480.1 hypothetical protein A1351_08880 [Methylosinus sp. R-45379]